MSTPRIRFGGVRLLLATALAGLLTGCSMPGRTAVAEIGGGTWSDPVELVLPNNDTTGCYDWQLFVRCDDRIAPEAFTLQITLLSPDSLRFSESVAVQLPASPAAAPVLREAAVDYRRRVRLSALGNYRLRIAPHEPLRGVEAVGIQTLKCD